VRLAHGRAKIASRQEDRLKLELQTAHRRCNAAFVVPRLRGIRDLGAAMRLALLSEYFLSAHPCSFWLDRRGSW